MKKELKRIIRELLRQGFEVERTSKGHYRVYLDGVWVTTLPGTPSDWRSFKNSLAAAKRAGFQWPP